MPAAVRSRLPALLGRRCDGVLGRAGVAGPGGHAAPRARRPAAGRDGGRAGRRAARAAGRRRCSSSARSRCCPRSRASTTRSCSCRSRAVRRRLLARPARRRAPRSPPASRSRAAARPARDRALRRRRALTSALFTLAITLGAPIVVGRLLRSRAALNRALREKAALLERRREDAAGRAVVDERTRIAGELHDVVAHALSAMTVQATGARRLALTRPELALAAFERDRDRRAARRSTSCAGCSASCAARTPSSRSRRSRRCATCSSLARRTTAAGLPVTLRVEGEAARARRPASTSPPTASSRTRSPRRSMSAARAAPRCRLRFGADALEIDVRDDGPLRPPRAR